MTKLMDKLCLIRDLVSSKDYGKLKFHKWDMEILKEEIHRQISKKVKSTNYSYNLELTSQDLRELAKDIGSLLKRWETAMCPEKNIKQIIKVSKVVDGKKQIDLSPLENEKIPIMTARTEVIQPLIELLNLIEYHAVYLYFIEEASHDEFALNYTERL